MKCLAQGRTASKWQSRAYEASRLAPGSVQDHYTRWAWHSDSTGELPFVFLVTPSPQLPSVFMGHWNKPARAVAPKMMILQLPPWHCHSRLPSPATGSSREYHRRFAVDQDFSGERAHRKSAVRNEVTFPSSLSRRSQVKSLHI